MGGDRWARYRWVETGGLNTGGGDRWARDRWARYRSWRQVGLETGGWRQVG